MAKIILLIPKFAILSKKNCQNSCYGQECYNNGTGAFSSWHFNKNRLAYLIGLILYAVIDVILGIGGGIAGIIIRGKKGWTIIGVCCSLAVVLGIITLISMIAVFLCYKSYKKYVLSEELYDYTKSVGDSLSEYKRLLDHLQAKFTLPQISNQSGYFGFAQTIYDEFFDIKELVTYGERYNDFTKAYNNTLNGYEGYVARELQRILDDYKNIELGQLQSSDALEIDLVVNNYPEVERLYNELDKINKKYQAKILYLYEEDQSIYHNVEVLQSKLRDANSIDAFSGDRKYADKGIFVDLYAKYDSLSEDVKVETKKAYDSYIASIKPNMSKVLDNVDAEQADGEEDKLPLVFTTKNEYLDAVNDLNNQLEEVKRKIQDNVERVDLVLSRLDERVNILRKTDQVAEVDFFETLLNTCDVEEINVKVTRIFQMLKRLRQQAIDYNKVVEDVKAVIREEVYTNESLNIDTVPKRAQNYIDENIDVREFISDLNVQMQIDEIKKRLHSYPIYLYGVYISNDDVDQVSKSFIRGYKFDGYDKKKNNVLHLCARNNAVKCFDYFFKRIEAKALEANADGETPLDVANKYSRAIFDKLSNATILSAEYEVKYHNYQVKANLDQDVMRRILNSQIEYWEYMANTSSNEDLKLMCMSNADNLSELIEAYDESPSRFAKNYSLKEIDEKYNKIVALVKNRETTSGAARYINILRKYEKYYDKRIIDAFENDFVDAVEFLNTRKIDIIYVLLKNYIAVNNSSYVTSLYKTEYQQNDLMLSTNMFYIERVMIGVYSCQNILTLLKRETEERKDNIIDVVTQLKNKYVKTLEELYEDNPNKYAYRLLAEEDREFASSHDENDIYYKVLGVSRQSTLAEIKKAYKRQILAHHRDRGGDSSKVTLINDAYAKLLLDKDDKEA